MMWHIPEMPENWNRYISAERTNRYAAAAIKRSDKEMVSLCCKGKYDGKYPAMLQVRPHFSNKRSDLDNVRFKGILDGLVSEGLIENDNLTRIQRIEIEPAFWGEGLDIAIGEYDMKNQCERIVDYMKRFGSITTMDAFTDLGVTRLASRIHDLREGGMHIMSTTETRKNRFGETVHYARYTIVE